MLPTMRAADARIQSGKAPLQGSNLLRLLAQDFGSVGAFSEEEGLKMSSASSFYQKKHHAALQGSNLLGLLAQDFGSVGAFSEEE